MTLSWTRSTTTTTTQLDSVVAKNAGEAALSSVQWLGHRMTEPELTMQRPASVLKSSTYFGAPSNLRRGGEVQQSLFQMADDSYYETTEEQLRQDDAEIKNSKVEGTGGSIYGASQRQLTKFSKHGHTTAATSSSVKNNKADQKQKQVWEALASLEKDSTWYLYFVRRVY